jgi:hypothetical protein
LAQYRADAAGDARHNSASRHCHEACHEGVFDEILAAAIPPGPHEKKKSSIISHFRPSDTAFLPQSLM